jgi:hypothetical protein
MGYYTQEQSVGLKPIVVTLSIIAMIGFGLMYFYYGKVSVVGDTPATSANPAPVAAPTQAPVASHHV